MNNPDEKNIDPIQEMTRLAENFLGIGRWNFKESFRSKTTGDLIYDSEWCRVNLVWGGWDYADGNTISLYYGRLHALNQKATMIWNGEECHCWHRIEYALYFLDGRTPSDAVRMKFSHPIKDQFYEPLIMEQYTRRQPEWLVRMHATIWHQYDKKLFELFDLRHPDLWDQYRQFLKEFFDIKGRRASIKPASDKVC